MKTLSSIAAVGLLLALSACTLTEESGYPPRPGGNGSYGQTPAPYPGAPPNGGYDQGQQPYAPPSQEYLPHLRDEYRNGHKVGAQDRSYGYPNDYSRAYARFGNGYESYFQEGYADGYSGRPMAH